MLNYALFLSLIQDVRNKDKKLYAALDELAKTNLAIPDLDSGNIYCPIGGATVKFNKAFKKVDSIILSVASGNYAYYASHTFNYDSTNATEFIVYTYDALGNPVASQISWIAFGVTNG